MTKYINADEIPSLFNEEYKHTRNLIEQGETHLDNLAEGFLEAKQVIDRMTSADVVEIIRCEKCKHRINAKEHLFNNCCLIHRDSHGFPMEKESNDFCSRGERKETE